MSSKSKGLPIKIENSGKKRKHKSDTDNRTESSLKSSNDSEVQNDFEKGGEHFITTAGFHENKVG